MHTQERIAEVVYDPSDQSYRWLRSSSGWIGGVCEGLARSFSMPVWAMRLIWVLGTFLALGTGVLFYAIFAYCLPDEHNAYEVEQKKVLGVCLRLSRALNMEVGLVRVLTVLLSLASFGMTVVGYIILNFLVPDRPTPIR